MNKEKEIAKMIKTTKEITSKGLPPPLVWHEGNWYELHGDKYIKLVKKG